MNISGGMPTNSPDARKMKLATTLLYRIAVNIPKLDVVVGSGMLLSTPSKLWGFIWFPRLNPMNMLKRKSSDVRAKMGPSFDT